MVRSAAHSQHPYARHSGARFAALHRSAALADARHHLASVAQSPHTVEYLRTVLSLCRESSRGSALEVETGSGLAPIWLSLRGVRAEGEDLSPQAVERARALNSAVDGSAVFRVGDPFADDRKRAKPVAVIHHAGLLEHFTVPWIRALLARQVARAEHVVFTVPSVYYPYEPEFGARDGVHRGMAADRRTGSSTVIGLQRGAHPRRPAQR